MIRTFASVPGPRIALAAMLLMLMAGATTASAQETSTQPAQAQQQPDQSSSQETAQEEETPSRKARPRNYKKWNFNVGGGASLTNGTTTQFVRGGGAIAAAGIARNASKYLGLRLDFQWDNLPLRNSALQLAQAPGGTSHVYSFMLDPIINVPATKLWSGYFLIGPSYYHRSGKLDSSTVIPGSACNAFWSWWGTCFNGSVPLNKNFLSASQNEFGYNLGGGIARKIRPNLELYGEFRYLHGKHNNITSDLRPITIGLRW